MQLPPVVKTSSLYRSGLTRHQIEGLVGSGRYRRLGRGWLAGDGASSDVVRALRSGYRLTCVSAAAEHGLWVPPHGRELHVFRSRHLREPCPSGFRLHRPEPLGWPDDEPVAVVELALEHAARCRPAVNAAILLESAWNRKILDIAGVAAVLRRVPLRERRPLLRLRSDAESGTETRVRWELESLRVEVRSQQVIEGVGRVDLLVGNRWVIECDSVAHHTGTDNYAADRRRDLELRRRGYLVTRLTWHQVFVDWEATRRALLEILRRREHRRHPLMAV